MEEDVEHNYRVVRFEVMPKSVKLEGKSLIMQRNVKVKLHEKTLNECNCIHIYFQLTFSVFLSVSVIMHIRDALILILASCTRTR